MIKAKRDLAKKPKFKSAVLSTIGNLIEWYDWYAYSICSLYLAAAFFPEDDPTVQLLNTAGIFATGFLMRPLGGWIFGSCADRLGRKSALTASVLLMCGGSLIIACVPTYETIGYWAPVLLLVARLLQGLSVGGEYGAAATYLSEVAPANRRGLYASFQAVTITLGQVTALSIILLLQHFFLTTQQLEAWGWRIPFVIGALLALVAWFFRRNLEETASFKKQKDLKDSERGRIRTLLKHKASILKVMGLTLGGTVAYYSYTTYMLKYLVNSLGLSKDTATQLSFLSLTLFLFLQPVLGRLSDTIGRRPVMMAFGLLGTLSTIPIMTTMIHLTDVLQIFGLMLCGLFIVSGYTSVNPIMKAELFPTEVRALGVSLPFSLTVAIFGGTVEYVALYFKHIGHESWFFWYVTVCIFISLISCFMMQETKTTSLLMQ